MHLHRFSILAVLVACLSLGACSKPPAGPEAAPASSQEAANTGVTTTVAASNPGMGTPTGTDTIQKNIDPQPYLVDFKDVLGAYRKIIVLLADEKKASRETRNNPAKQQDELADQIARVIFHDNRERLEGIEKRFDTLFDPSTGNRLEVLDTLLNYVESGAGLYDADRLAFRELLCSLQERVAKDSTLPAVKLHKRISEDLDALAEIERNYEKEIAQIFNRFETRAIELKRERWSDYVAHLKKIYSREEILKEYGYIVPYPSRPDDRAKEDDKEIFGRALPPKTVVLTFDDGPHPTYTAEIAAILQQYGIPAVFFEVGRNLGAVDGEGKATLSRNAKISAQLKASGYELANHSFSHAQLSKRSGDALKAEIANTDILLKAIDEKRSPLFRFPYGARNSEGMNMLTDLKLKSVMWNIDSLDWADPIPRSIADRVMNTVNKEGRGIILFHDIHERTIKALPQILDQLIAEGYQFAGWDGSNFTVGKKTSAPQERAQTNTNYANSWAIVIGIDQYAKWPKLHYAVRDAQALRQTLIEKFKFLPERVFMLTDAEATRTNILATFHDRLAHDGVQKNDRIFVFFAGHGATRKLSSGRDLGYIVPADSDPEHFATDAIPMSEIQNIAESLSAKHILFVMDACYSGLGLTRGGGPGNFLKDNSKRIGRQMLTAGGGDQLVADGGPNGHSVFTWTLLQGLAGKADLNGDGLITATELAAYVAPAVAGVSNQTPAFGSLPGSEGGEFIFELPGESEFISPQTTQLSGEAIALNNKLDETMPVIPPVSSDAQDKKGKTQGKGKTSGKKETTPPATTVVIKDLQGDERRIELAPATLSTRQRAQRANDRGLQFYKEKRYAEAETEFTEALKLRPDFALAANNLGFVFYKQEKYKEATRWFENTVKIDPSRAIAYLNLGDALQHGKENEKAQKAYRTYLELAPNSPSATYATQQLEKLGQGSGGG